MFRWFKVGGLRFVRIGRLQLSFCVCRKTTVTRERKSRDVALVGVRSVRVGTARVFA